MFYSYTCTLPTPTEAGVPYTVSIFAENSAGNGTKCNVTDFTNELGMFYNCTHQYVVLLAIATSVCKPYMCHFTLADQGQQQYYRMVVLGYHPGQCYSLV